MSSNLLFSQSYKKYANKTYPQPKKYDNNRTCSPTSDLSEWENTNLVKLDYASESINIISIWIDHIIKINIKTIMDNIIQNIGNLNFFEICGLYFNCMKPIGRFSDDKSITLYRETWKYNNKFNSFVELFYNIALEIINDYIISNNISNTININVKIIRNSYNFYTTIIINAIFNTNNLCESNDKVYVSIDKPTSISSKNTQLIMDVLNIQNKDQSINDDQKDQTFNDDQKDQTFNADQKNTLNDDQTTD
jgi:hypothetical protein